MKKNIIDALEAVTTIDGRYREKVEDISRFVSEKGLMCARLEVEVLYLLALSEADITRRFTQNEKNKLHELIENFSLEDAQRIKEIEETTRHDVKAVEYFIREKLSGSTLSDIAEKTHLFLTSEDTNNISQRLVLSRAVQRSLLPHLGEMLTDILGMAEEYHAHPMLARTHGQNAVPTTVGKEFAVFADRLSCEIEKLKVYQFKAKLNGAVGNYNSFKMALPKKTYNDWKKFSADFVSRFGFSANYVSTQINTYEDVIECLQILQRVNGILIDFASDMWRYISDGWLLQKKVTSEVGSSTMPQKINPIDFENGEGNLSLANDVIKGLVDRLPVSRLQRDLRDSTQIRNIGLIAGFMTVGLASIRRGLSKIAINSDVILSVLNTDWSILSEGAQVYLRTHEEVADPYQLFKDITRGNKMTQEDWVKAVDSLPVSENAKKEFKNMTPSSYTGFASEITLETVSRIKKL